jgi:hypothetical protein
MNKNLSRLEGHTSGPGGGSTHKMHDHRDHGENQQYVNEESGYVKHHEAADPG